MRAHPWLEQKHYARMRQPYGFGYQRPFAESLPMVTRRVADIPSSQAVARRIARFLRFMRGRAVPVSMLVDYVYGDRPNGPPKHPVQSIYAIVWRLHGEGFPVGSVRKRGAFIWDEERVFAKRRRRRYTASSGQIVIG
jgi:hypothetical protein